MAASAPLGGDSGRPSVLCGGAGLVLLSLVAQQEAARGWRALGVTLAAPFCGAFLSVSSSPPASSHSAGWLLEPLSLCSLGRGLAVQRLGPRALTAGGTGSSPVGGTKILHALRRGQKKKRERERDCALCRGLGMYEPPGSLVSRVQSPRFCGLLVSFPCGQIVMCIFLSFFQRNNVSACVFNS